MSDSSKSSAARGKNGAQSATLGGDALFSQDEVDLDARHPAHTPVEGFPAPSSVVLKDEFETFDDEDDPFAGMLSELDVPGAISAPSPLRAAQEAKRTEQAGPVAISAGESSLVEDFAMSAPAEFAMSAPAPTPPVAPKPKASPKAAAPVLPKVIPAPVAEIAPVIDAEPDPMGLKIARRYTKIGEDVWKTAAWELRTASITGGSGEIVFKQDGVEVPTSWSQMATNVVASKYFRGQVGTLEREYSVKQLVARVADTFLTWGKEGSYFASDEDASAFHDELRYILIHQLAAFNSPVWFNLGWPGRRQAISACLPYDVRVNTDRGLVPIGEIVRLFQSTPNPQIFTYGPDGAPSRIVNAVCNGRRRVINFHLGDGSTLRCTSNHRVFVRGGKGEIVEKEAGQMVPGVDKLILNRHPLMPESSEAALGLLTPGSELAWLTGLMVGDGYCGRSRTLTSDTWDLKISTAAEKDRAEAVLTKYGIPFRTHIKSWGFCLRGHGAVSRGLWQTLGIWGRVNDKDIPEWIFRASRENVCAFLGGLFDSDGHVAKVVNRRLPVFSNTSLPLAQGVQILLRSLGIFSSLTSYIDSRDDYSRKPSYTLGIHDNVSVEKFQSLIGFTHEAKQEKMDDRLLDAMASWRTPDVLLVSKSLGGPEFVFDIQTESETFWAEGILLHNCYINEVSDDMDSILELYKTEGMLFKDGSGSGLNLSPLRGSNEPLAAGGRSSGPISFMKGLDASAGSIKSGGSTRRAACMRVLDVDHPDIMDFINCKKDAEEKAHALIEAGYSGAFNVPNGAYDTVPFQNANHSVRVTDEFMQAVESDGPWSAKNRLNGKPTSTYRAREVMQKIGEATWVCGDPGMQYDTTINDWHTCANTDRIYASNPCCITADTLVAVADGRNAVPIKELIGTEVPVYAHDHSTGRTTVSRMWNIGIKRESVPVYRVRLDDGSDFRATDDHLIMLRDGSYRMVKDLKPGDSLMPFHSSVLKAATSRTKRRYYWNGTGWNPQYRAVWNYAHGVQPDGWHLHHQDFDALNDVVSNLVLLEAVAHLTLHGDKMRGDNNPARRFMTDEWRENIGNSQRGTKNGNYGRTHSEDTRSVMRAKSALRWTDNDEHVRSGQAIKAALARTKAEGRPVGRPAGERFDRCCPVCRTNYTTRRVEQIFCSDACRCSPMGRRMSGEKIWAQTRGRSLSVEHRAKISSASRTAGFDPDAKRRACLLGHRAMILKAARLLMDAGVTPSLEEWDSLRSQAHELGANHVPTKATVERHFSDDTTLRAETALYNHKVLSVEFDGNEDVYDGTVDVHHNFAILTSSKQACVESELNYSGIFIHNSEYMFLNSTACNLASLNLMRFRDDKTGAFDADAYEHVCRVVLTAQEIGVGFAEYPTPKITQRSYDFRSLGLGYANLGALLMAGGLPYDSDAGRAYAASVTAIMTGTAYAQSAAIARDCGGPFAGYADNKEPMLRVMKKHRAAVDAIDSRLVPLGLLDRARKCWDEAVAIGTEHGYRNAQASVLAPTGTIGFLLDCDTTGVEPDIAIVKYKSLVGGGMMKIVNQTVPEALRRLGYSEAQVGSILEFIDQNDTIEGAPELKKEHLPIFDCAFRPTNGTRTIHYTGHIKMMAAVQPFLSGAISKTVNVPEDATAEEISEVYIDAWKRGIKAVAVYRDNSKKTQPLSTRRETTASVKGDPLAEALKANPVRRKLPDERPSITHKFSVGGHEGYLTVGLYPETHMPGEIFLRMSKEGSTISGLMDGFATAVSLSLQYGVPLATLVDKFIHSRFEPSGFTGNKDIPMAKSVMDYIFRWLALKFLQKEERQNVGLIADQEPETPSAQMTLPVLSSPPPALPKPNGGITSSKGGVGKAEPVTGPAASFTDHEREIYRLQADAPPCPECGALCIRSGACYKCLQCGTSLGCS